LKYANKAINISRLNVIAFALSTIFALPVAHAQTSPFSGVSIFTSGGFQSGSVKLENVRVRNTSFSVPAENLHSTGNSWLIGLNYTHMFQNSTSLGAQVEFFPVSKQVILSVTPGFQFTDDVQGYLKLGWVHAPSTVDQGPGRRAYNVNLHGMVAGLGTKVAFAKNFYGFIEINYVQLQKLNFTSWEGPIPIEGTAKTSAQNVMLGVGYRF